MGKKRIYIKNHRKGEFWINYFPDGQAHIAKIVKKDAKSQTFVIVKFTHSKKGGNIPLEKNIDSKDSKPCYVYPDPYISSRASFGKKVNDVSIKTQNDKNTIKMVSKRNPLTSKKRGK